MSGFRYQQGATQISLDPDTTLDLLGTVKVEGVAMGCSLSFSPAAGGSNVCEVTITVKDGAGNTVAGVFNLDVWLSDAASGAGLTGTTASGTVQAKAASGAVLGTFTAKKALHVQTLATGIFVLEITDSAKTGFYVAGTVPFGGATAVSAQLVTGNYG